MKNKAYNFSKNKLAVVFFPNERSSFIFYMFLIGFIASSLCAYLSSTTNSLEKLLSVDIFILFSSIVGGFFGFVFGMPRSNIKEKNNKDEKHQDDIEEYSDNTNLQEISDWMTKIIVGVGLTQFRSISDELYRFNKKISSDFNFGPESFSETVLIYFSLLGFFAAYFWAKFEYNEMIKNNSRYNFLNKKVNFLKKQVNTFNHELEENTKINEAKIAIDSDKVSNENKRNYIIELDEIIRNNPLNRNAAIVRARFADEFEKNTNLAIKIVTDFINEKHKAHETDYDMSDALYNRSIYNLKNGSIELCYNDLSKSVKIKPLNKNFAKNDKDFSSIVDKAEFQKIVE